MAVQASISFWQLLSVVAVPTLMIFLGILFNRQDYRNLDAKIAESRHSLDAKISESHNNLDARISQLHNSMDAKIGQLHSDMIMVHSILREFEGRLSKLESRS